MRYFNPVGSHPTSLIGDCSADKPNNLVPIICEVASGKRESMQIFGNDYNTPDGTAIRDYIHVSDLADIHLKAADYLLENKNTEIFNCGYGFGYSVLDVINAANKLYNNSIKFDFLDRRPGDSEQLIANVDKLHEYMKWKPKFNDLNLIIKTSVEWEKKINEKNI